MVTRFEVSGSHLDPPLPYVAVFMTSSRTKDPSNDEKHDWKERGKPQKGRQSKERDVTSLHLALGGGDMRFRDCTRSFRQPLMCRPFWRPDRYVDGFGQPAMIVLGYGFILAELLAPSYAPLHISYITPNQSIFGVQWYESLLLFL